MWKYTIVILFLVFDLTKMSTMADSDRSKIHCKADYGNYVDWFVVYKFPSSAYDGYMYMTSETAAQGWTVSNHTIQQPNSMIARSISRMYLKDSKEMWLAYSDNWWWFNRGHSKGILGGDSEGGIWLVHSVPHFPKSRKYGYPWSGKRNGQGALCISLTAGELDKIGDALSLYGPHYDVRRFSTSLDNVYPTIRSTLDGQQQSEKSNFSFNLTSKGGLEFRTFAKSKSFGKDIYEWIGSSLDTSLYVETWRTALMPFPSSCNGLRKIVNVKAIEYAPKKISFSYSIDHSKWAISTIPSKPYVCIGDINRSEHQLSRGGGSVCTSSPELWKAFFGIISETESCKSS